MPRAPERPTAVLVIAIFHFIFGGLGLLCGLCALGGLAMKGAQPPAQAQMQAEIDAIMAERVPLFQVYTGANVVLGLIWSVVILVSGMGLLNLRPWGRQLSIFYGVSRLIWAIFSIVYTVVWVNAANEEAMSKIKMPPGAEGMQGFISAMSSFGLVIQFLFLIYPAIVLLIMFLPAVRAAFAGGAPPLDRFEDDDEDDDENDDFDDRDRPGDEGVRSRPRN